MPNAPLPILRGLTHLRTLLGEAEAHLREPERRIDGREDEMLRPGG